MSERVATAPHARARLPYLCVAASASVEHQLAAKARRDGVRVCVEHDLHCLLVAHIQGACVHSHRVKGEGGRQPLIAVVDGYTSTP